MAYTNKNNNTKECKNCSGKFVLKTPNQIYCSKKCKYAYNWRKKNPLLEQECPVCNKTFMLKSNRGHRIYCGEDCYKKAQVIISKDSSYMRKYGITWDIYGEILDSQNGCCKICKKHHSCFDKALAVDHCHNTGKVRGLLCSECNRGLGYFKDNILLLTEAISYLKR